MKTNYLYLLMAFLIISCGKDDDNNARDKEAPVVEKVLLNGQDSEVHLHHGEILKAELYFTDNEELASAKVEIHPNEDDHSHRISAEEFTFNEIIVLTGKSASANFEVMIPQDAETGEYHFSVQVIDAKGNESGLKVYEFEVAEEH